MAKFRHTEKIAYCGISQYAIPGGNQRLYDTTIYNLEVLNKLGMFKSAGSLTKFLKQQGVDNELSDVPDKSGYPYTIFDVEKALKVV